MKKNILIFAVGAMFLTGCMSAPVDVSNRKPIPQERLFSLQAPVVENGAVLSFTRDTGMGHACLNALYIDNILVAKFAVRETAKFYVTPGEHLVKYGRDPDGRGLCGNYQNMWVQEEVNIKHNEKKSYRLIANEVGMLIQRDIQ